MLKESGEPGHFCNSAHIQTILRLALTSVHSCNGCSVCDCNDLLSLVLSTSWGRQQRHKLTAQDWAKQGLRVVCPGEPPRVNWGQPLSLPFSLVFEAMKDWDAQACGEADTSVGTDTAWPGPYHVLKNSLAASWGKKEGGGRTWVLLSLSMPWCSSLSWHSYGSLCYQTPTNPPGIAVTLASHCKLQGLQCFGILCTRGCLLPAQLYQSSLIFP